MKKIILITLLLVSSLFAEFTTLTTEQVQDAIKKGVKVIDIRRADEFNKYGTIKGSYKLTFFGPNGKYDLNKWMTEFQKIVKDRNQPFILVCAHSNRSKVVGKFLSDKAGYKNVQELDGGINYGWIDKGLSTIKN